MSNEDISKSLKNIETSVHDDFIKFAQKLVQTKSLTCQEREVASLVEEKMKDLGYDEVTVDSVGNVLGRIGNGAKILMFDSHMDTVTVNNLNEWEHDPFGAAIENADGKTDAEIAAEGLDKMEAWMKKIGLVMQLRELGVKEDMFDAIPEILVPHLDLHK